MSVRNTIYYLLFTLSAASLAQATNFYVAPNGSSSGDGSIGNPWNISTAFGAPSSVHPGDTVWLRGGTYGSGGKTAINSSLAGTSSQPVYVRQYPGERATIDSGLGIYGNYAWYWGLEIGIDNWTRSTSECGSFPSNKAADAVFFNQGVVGTKLINMVIHDGADGIADEQESSESEDYGNLLYNNGWASSCDRGHGHNLYMQNASSVPKIIQDNISYNSFDIGMQAYGSAPPISHLHFIGNVFFNSGVPGGHRVDNVLVTNGSTPKQDILFQNNVAYNPLDAAPAETGYNQLGDSGNLDLTVQNNYWIGATPSGYETLYFGSWQTSTFQGNMVVGKIVMSGTIGTYNWSGNTYYNSAPPSGVDSNSPVIGNNPTGVNIVVRPNKYEPGRAHIVVMNWDKSASVTVDLSGSGLTNGTAFEIRDAQNFWGTPVLTGTYNGGSITLPMTQTTVSQIPGFQTPPHTSAEFGAFVLLPVGTLAPPPPPSQMSVCDANKDGSTNVVDVQISVNQALGLAACSADVNLDGHCDVIDVQRIVNASLGGQCVSP